MSSQPILDNQLLGCLSLADESFSNPVQAAGINLLASSKSLNGHPWHLQLFGTPNTVILKGSAPEHDASAYLWGTVAHPDIETSQIPGWAAQIVAEKRYERLKELLGYFVIFVAQPKQRRLSIISDILGVRPLFYRCENNRLIFGSDAWLLQHAGFTSGEIDLDAVSSWIVYSCNYTDKAVFTDLRRLEAGSVSVFEDGQQNVIPYLRFPVSNRLLSPKETAAQIHAIVERSCRTVLSQHRKINIALSGGYDSRYLLAIALEANANIDKIGTVGYPKEEGLVAKQVASVLDVQLETEGVSGAVWDYFDDVFHFTPDGFPVTKHVSYCLPKRHPGVPVVNGYLGGPLLRAYELKGFNEPSGNADWPAILQEKNTLVGPVRLARWFGEELTRRILRRALHPMALALEKGAYTNKLISWADLYYVQGRYLANNFLQHLYLTEALLPLYSYELLAFKFDHHPNVLNKEVYLNIFRANFPKLATIPHAHDLEVANAARINSAFLSRLANRPLVSRYTAKWARQLLPAMMDRRSILRKKATTLYALASTSYFLQRLNQRFAEGAETAIFNFERFHLLEQRCRDAGLDLDWKSI